jgi:hypothetical protein
MKVRFVRLGVAALAGFLLGSCSSTGNFVGDNLPAWAGGLPPDTPPRPGTPEYEAYWKALSGNAPLPAKAAPVRPANPPPARKPKEAIDEPIH